MAQGQRDNGYPMGVITYQGERYIKASDVVQILLHFEDDLPSEGAQELAWILAQLFGCALAESPTLALRELST